MATVLETRHAGSKDAGAEMQRLSVFGLGYVGTVCAACFAEMGHRVVGIDTNPVKAGLISDGKPPIVEERIADLVADVVRTGRLRATTDVRDAIRNSSISFICVGTPSAPNGSLNVDALRSVSIQIGEALRDKPDHHTVVVRSTVLPGTIRDVIAPSIVAASGKKAGSGFDLAINPEFMREGSAVADFYNPSRTIVGADSVATAERILELYKDLPGEKIATEIAFAELAKYVDNTWHALKVAFANEVGSICKSLGIDSHAAMDIFTSDTKLNISRAYLKPGFAFGGSCLPKDIRALSHFANARDLNLPVIRNVMKSNLAQIERGVDWILSEGKRKVTFLGFSFKSGTDDLRESPYLEVVERLIGKGCNIRIYDPNVELSRLIGANRDFLVGKIPHIAELMVPTVEEAVAHGEVIVVTQADRAYDAAIRLLRADQRVLDFGHAKAFERGTAAYDGFSW